MNLIKSLYVDQTLTTSIFQRQWDKNARRINNRCFRGSCCRWSCTDCRHRCRWVRGRCCCILHYAIDCCAVDRFKVFWQWLTQFQTTRMIDIIYLIEQIILNKNEQTRDTHRSQREQSHRQDCPTAQMKPMSHCLSRTQL